MDSIRLKNIKIGRDFNIILKSIEGIDDLQRINDYFLSSSLASSIYIEIIEYFTSSEGYFSENIRQIFEEIDGFLADEYIKINQKNASCSKVDDVGIALARIKDGYKGNSSKLAYINYLQGCLLQVQFRYIRAYAFFADACNLEKNINYFSAAGELAMKLGKYEEAEMYFYFCLCKLEDQGEIYNTRHIECLNNIGGALDQQFRFENAISYYHEAEFLLKQSESNLESDLYLGLVYNNLGGAYTALCDFEKSEKYLLESLNIRSKISATTNEIAITQNNLAEVYRLKKETNKAKYFLEQAEALLKNTYNKYVEKHPTLAMTFNNLGNLSLENKKYSAAKIYFEKALIIWKNSFENSHNRESIVTLYNLAITCWHSSQYKQALSYFHEAKDLSNILIERKDLKETEPLFMEMEKDYLEFTSQKKYKFPLLKFIYFR